MRNSAEFKSANENVKTYESQVSMSCPQPMGSVVGHSTGPKGFTESPNNLFKRTKEKKNVKAKPKKKGKAPTGLLVLKRT